MAHPHPDFHETDPGCFIVSQRGPSRSGASDVNVETVRALFAGVDRRSAQREAVRREIQARLDPSG